MSVSVLSVELTAIGFNVKTVLCALIKNALDWELLQINLQISWMLCADVYIFSPCSVISNFSLLPSVTAPWRREASSEQRDHRSQQPPDGGETHHWETTAGQCKTITEYLYCGAVQHTVGVKGSFIPTLCMLLWFVLNESQHPLTGQCEHSISEAKLPTIKHQLAGRAEVLRANILCCLFIQIRIPFQHYFEALSLSKMNDNVTK